MGKRINFNDWDCELVKEEYQAGGSPALALVAWQDDISQDICKGEPIATCTVNLPDVPLRPDEVIIKDYSENTGMLNTLLDAGVVEMTGKTIDTGFVTCPICVLVSIK
jgi:hypothetical protein